MDDKPHHSQYTAKSPSSPAHHAPSTGHRHDEIEGAAFVAAPDPSTTTAHGVHNKVPHAILFPSNVIASSAFATASSSPSLARFPKPSTPPPSSRHLDPPSPTPTTTPSGQSNNNNNNKHASILGPILGAAAGLVLVICALLWFFLRRRKRSRRRLRLESSAANEFSPPSSTMERGNKMAGHDNNNDTCPSSTNYSRTSLHQPPTSRDAKRLTADTLVSSDRRSSLSTMVSKKQYTPQLAYSPHGIDKNDLLCVSPSNTLIDAFSAATEDDEKRQQQQQQQQQQRVASYQPQIVVDTDSDMQNYYDYLNNNENNNDRRSMINPQQQQQQQKQPREDGHQ